MKYKILVIPSLTAVYWRYYWYMYLTEVMNTQPVEFDIVAERSSTGLKFCVSMSDCCKVNRIPDYVTLVSLSMYT